MFVGEGLGQDLGAVIQPVQDQEVLPGHKGLRRRQGGDPADRLGLPDAEQGLAFEARGREKGGPVQAGGPGGQLGAAPALVGLGVVLAGHRVEVGLGDGRFQRQHAGGAGVRVLQPGQGEHLGGVGLEGGAGFGEAGGRVEVVVGAGHAQPALEQVGDVAGGLVGVLADPGPEQVGGVVTSIIKGIDVGAQGAAKLAGQRALAGDQQNPLKIALNRRQAALLDSRLVQIGLVEVARLLLGRALRRGGLGQALELGAQARRGLLVQDVEGAPARFVGRDLGGLGPGSVGVGVEVVAGLHRAVHARGVEAVVADLGLAGRLGEGGAARQGEGGCQGEAGHSHRALRNRGPHFCRPGGRASSW